MRRVVALVALLALLLGSIAGALVFFTEVFSTNGSAPERLDEDESGPDAAAPPEPELARYYSQVLAWESCGSTFRCSWLTVPLDYDEPDGESIEVLVLKLPATGERIGSLVVNPGGPGAPGTQYAAAGPAAFGEPLLQHFDVVGFDPRGTGESEPVDCLTDEQLDAYLAGNPTPRTPAEVAEARAENKKFLQGCRRRSGDLVDHVSTAEAARDMDVLRAALDEEKLDYFGASYGTALGATYAELFPGRVGHFVLDGGVDISADLVEKSLVQAGGFETALRAYVEDCLDQSSCPLEGDVEDGLAQVTGLVEQVAEDPMETGSDRALTAGRAFYGIVMPLYNRDYWPLLTSGLSKALQDGDGSALLMTADLYASRGPNGYQDNSTEAIVAINCLDDPSYVPADEVSGYFDRFEKVSPTFGRVFAWGLTGCEHFTGGGAEPLEVDGSGAAPIVVTGTTRDPATPMSWAEALADQLESAVLVRRDGDGHTAYNAGNACVDEAIEEYLLDGKVPEDGLSC